MTGETAEALFLVECQKLGINCSKPFSGKLGYDFISEYNGITYKIQVKTTVLGVARFRRGRGDRRSKKTGYKKQDVDFFAVLDSKLNDWFLIPYSPTIKNISLTKLKKDTWSLLKT